MAFNFNFAQIASALTFGLWLGCSNGAESDQAQTIAPKEAAALYAEKKAVIIDVREDGEWKEGHIPGAIHIPLSQLEGRMGELKAYQNAPIITQCRSGKRSAQAQQQLLAKGFTNVYSLSGGLNAWAAEGLATE